MLEDPEISYHANYRITNKDQFDNCLIFGDNLLALKAIEQDYVGKIKCVYVDPPFNTGEAFEHYDDGLEHSLWLALMRDRIELLHRLLSPDGTFCVQIDDNHGVWAARPVLRGSGPPCRGSGSTQRAQRTHGDHRATTPVIAPRRPNFRHSGRNARSAINLSL